MKLNIVVFNTGQFGVQVRFGRFQSPKYVKSIINNPNYVNHMCWADYPTLLLSMSDKEEVMKKCQFPSKDEASKALMTFISARDKFISYIKEVERLEVVFVDSVTHEI